MRHTIFILPLLLVLSCGENAREPLPDWGAGYPGQGDAGVPDGDGGPPGGGTASGKMALRPAPAEDVYPARIYDLATLKDCAIDFEDPEASRDITCRMDVKELDLYVQGLIFDLHAPEGACEYLVYRWYQYEAWEVGTGATDVSYTVDPDGNIINESGTVNGEPYCPYNYEPLGGESPNCCLGTYTLTVTDQRTTPPTVTVQQRSWSDPCDLVACYDGAAFADQDKVVNECGWPMAIAVVLRRQGYDRRFDLGPIADRYYTNVPYANYYDPADHDGLQPAGLAPERIAAVPYYTLACTDDAEEVVGRIRLIVREWNEESEFFEQDPVTHQFTGDPETEGPDPIAGEINDIWDWKDSTPGSTTWIQDRD